MKVIGKKRLDNFCSKYSDVRSQVASWLYEAEEARWDTPGDIKERYVHASFLSSNHVIFNLKGNKYRLEVKIDYKRQTVIVKRIGTHSDYDKWD